MHECQECGQVCGCDQDDLYGSQPEDCECLARHAAGAAGDDDRDELFELADGYSDDDLDAGVEDDNDEG